MIMKENFSEMTMSNDSKTLYEERRKKEKEQKRRKYKFYDKLHTACLRCLAGWFFLGAFFLIFSFIGCYFDLLTEKTLEAMSVIYLAIFALIVVTLIGIVAIKNQYDDSGSDFFPNLYC